MSESHKPETGLASPRLCVPSVQHGRLTTLGEAALQRCPVRVPEAAHDGPLQPPRLRRLAAPRDGRSEL